MGHGSIKACKNDMASQKMLTIGSKNKFEKWVKEQDSLKNRTKANKNDLKKSKGDIPDDYRGKYIPKVGESGREFAARAIFKEKGLYPGEYEEHKGTDFSKLKKFADNDYKRPYKDTKKKG